MGEVATDGTQFHFHGALSGLVREETAFGREHLVAPVVMVRELVLDQGDHGELLPGDEIRRSAERWLWEGRPVTIDHPQDERGRWLSAGVLEAAESSEIGTLRNVEAEEDSDGVRLTGEAWIDVAKANRLERGAEIVERLRDFENDPNPTGTKPFEVSTGYWAELEKQGGIHGPSGERYRGIQRNVTPDHLAVLPNAVGKCSLEDGCGMPRLNADGEIVSGAWAGGDGDGQIRVRIRNVLESIAPDVFREAIDDVLGRSDDDADDAVARAASAGSDDDDGPGDDPGATSEDEETEMLELNDTQRAAIVAALVACAECDYEENVLEALSDPDLVAVARNREVEPDGVDLEALGSSDAGGDADGGGDDDAEPAGDGPAASGDDGGGGGGDDPEPAANADDDEETVALDRLPPEVRALVEDREEQRDERIRALARNDDCRLGESALRKLDDDELEQLEASLEQRTYAARGGPRSGGSGDGDSYFDENPRTPAVVTRKPSRDGDD